MKKIIVISGASGIGKTTTLIPAMVRASQLPYFGTGDLFKSIYGHFVDTGKLFYKGSTQKLLAPESLKYYFDSGDFKHGLEMYEFFKANSTISGNDIIYFIEMLRCIDPEIAVKSIGALMVASGIDYCITDTIHQAEFNQLDNRYEVLALFRFECESAVKRDADNRAIVQGTDHLTFDYTYTFDTINQTVFQLSHDLETLKMLNGVCNA